MPFTERSIGGHISPSQTASTYDTTLRSDLGEQSNLDLRNGSGYIEGDFRPSYSAEPESRDSISSAVKRHENDFLDYNFLKEKTTDVYDASEVGTQEQGGCSLSSVTWEEKRESFGPTLRESSTDGTVQEYNHNRDLESFSLNLVDMETLGDKGLELENVDQMDDQSCNGVVPEPESGEVHLDDVESETDNFMDALNTIESEGENDIDSTKKQLVEHLSKIEDKEKDDRECETGRHDLECQSSYLESNVMTSSSPIDGSHSPHGHSLSSVPRRSSQATDSINDQQPEDDLNSVPSVEKDLRSSERTAGSASPGCVESIESRKNDNIHDANHVEYVSSSLSLNFEDGRPALFTNETSKSPGSEKLGMFELERRELESQSFSPECTTEENSPLINGSSEHSLIPTYPMSVSATDSFISEPSREDDVNSISLLKKNLQSRTGNTASTGQPVRKDSYENGKVDAGNYVESVSSTVSSNLGDGMRKCPESDKHVPENSNVTSVSFWTNGGLLGLQPSKPPDFGALNALSQDPEHKKDGKNNLSIPHFILSDKDSGKPAQIESSRSIEEDLEMDDEYQEHGMAFRKASWKISPADLEIDLGKFGDPLCRNKANSTGASVTAPVSFMPVNSAHQESSTSSSRMFGLSNRLLSNGSNQKSLPGGTGNTNDFEPKNRQSVEFRSFSGRSKDLFSGKSPILSPSSSPPLEHMRISFQPMNGFESSKLKLKFPDGKTNSGSGTDIYPSFQLVPEVSIPQYNIGSDSDADTFYRSSPSLSDNDCHSNQSESNSEQWESSESPASKDRDLYDALRRISLTESIPENGKANQEHIHGKSELQFPFAENGLQNSESCRSFDLQSLSTINNSFRKEPRIDTNAIDHPLPPFERRGVMPGDEKSDALPEGSYYALDFTRSASTISQPKPAPLNEDQIDIKIMQKSKVWHLYILSLDSFFSSFIFPFLLGMGFACYLRSSYLCALPAQFTEVIWETRS